MLGKLSIKELGKALRAHLHDGSGISLLSRSDENDALEILTVAFKEDPMIEWVAGLEDDDPEKDPKTLELGRYMQAWINRRLISGSRGFALGIKDETDALVGIITVAPSSTAKEGIIDQIANTIKLGIPPMYNDKNGRYCKNSQKRLEGLEVLNKMRPNHMKDTKRWIYIQTLGVHPDHQGKGYGKKMMQLLRNVADSLQVPLYLETEAEHLEAMYSTRFGFRTLERVNVFVPGDTSSTANLTMYLMRKNPGE